MTGTSSPSFLRSMSLSEFENIIERVKEPPEEERARALFIETCGQLRENGVKVHEIRERVARYLPEYVGSVDEAIKQYARDRKKDPTQFFDRGRLRPQRDFSKRKEKAEGRVPLDASSDQGVEDRAESTDRGEIGSNRLKLDAPKTLGADAGGLSDAGRERFEGSDELPHSPALNGTENAGHSLSTEVSENSGTPNTPGGLGEAIATLPARKPYPLEVLLCSPPEKDAP